MFKSTLKRLFFACVISVATLAYGEEIPQEGQIHWCDISTSWSNPTHSKLTFVDLFCGAGGLAKGLEEAGLEAICGLDYFKEAGATFQRNFTCGYIDGDVTLPETKEALYDEVSKRLNGRRLSLVVGGFPCQGFSMAGDRIVDDPRNSLYKEMIEIVNHLQPDYVICENVKGIRSMLDGKVEQKILEDFGKIGYSMSVATLCAADYYVPQKRERVIFIGNRIGKVNYHPKPLLEEKAYRTVADAIADLMDKPEDAAINHVFTKHRESTRAKIARLAEGESLYPSYKESWRRCHWEEPSPTVKENHGGVIIHPKLPRVMTARELARLQSFPDSFIFEGNKSKQLIQIGNAVPVLLGKALGLAIRYSAGDLGNDREQQH